MQRALRGDAVLRSKTRDGVYRLQGRSAARAATCDSDHRAGSAGRLIVLAIASVRARRPASLTQLMGARSVVVVVNTGGNCTLVCSRWGEMFLHESRDGGVVRGAL